ncbi:MAG: helix-turn-helix domain-containing protein [Sporichthyaceae bacterium]
MGPPQRREESPLIEHPTPDEVALAQAAARVACAVDQGPAAILDALQAATDQFGLRPAGGGADIRAMRTVAARVLAAKELDEGLFAVTHEALHLLDADMAGVLLVDGDELVMRACAGNRELTTAKLRMRRGQGLAGHAFATGQPAKVDDYLHNDVISDHFHALAIAEATRSALCAPLVLDGEVIGVLEVWRRRESKFTEREIDRIVGLAELAAIALHHARLYDERAVHLREVEVSHRVLENQFRKVTHALSLQQDLVQALLDGERLSGVLRLVAARTESAVVLYDSDFEVRAAYPTTLDPAALVPVLRSALRTVAPSAKGTVWTTLDRQSVAVRPVHVGGDVLGWLCMVTGSAGAEDGVELSLTQASLACALHHLEEQAAARVRAALRDEVLLSLITGSTEERRAATARAKHVNVDLRGDLRVCVATFARLAEMGEAEGWTGAHGERVRRRLLAVCESALQDTGWLRLAARHGDTVVALVRAVAVDELRAVLQDCVEVVEKELPGVGAGWGVGATRSTPLDLAAAWNEACTATRALGVGANRAVALHEDLGILGLLLAGPGSLDLPRFVAETLGPAIAYDESHGTTLVETLRTYLDSDCSQQDTAARLFVHQKTVKYRLSQLQKLTGLDLRHHHDRMRADIAVRAADLG